MPDVRSHDSDSFAWWFAIYKPDLRFPRSSRAPAAADAFPVAYDEQGEGELSEAAFSCSC